MNPLELPKLTKYINDFSSVLSPEQVESLSQSFISHESTSTEQVVTVFIPHRQGHELLDIGLKAFNENGIGQKNLNNGLLLIVATEEKKLRIVVGKGLELKYTEMVCRDIVENHLRPLLIDGKYEEMVEKWGEIIKTPLDIKNIANVANKSYISESETFPKDEIKTSSLIQEHILAIVPSVILVGISLLASDEIANIAIFIAIFWIIGYTIYNLFSKKIQEVIKIGLMLSIILAIIILGISAIQHCNENPTSCNSSNGSNNSSSDWGSSDSSSSSDFDGGGGSSNGGGYGD
ncbi:TPM domain-containing protein [Candidatus Gracilibacteria bacterium]|nr:TPM domain-containing protein [Candidatus Gracilibacteria bacterium]